MYREFQISSEKSNLALYLPNNPLEWLFKKKLILENPQSLCIWRILEKFENSQKIPFLFMKLVKISDDFKQTVYTGAKKLLRIIIIIMAFLLLFLFLFLYIKHFLSYLQPFVFLVTFWSRNIQNVPDLYHPSLEDRWKNYEWQFFYSHFAQNTTWSHKVENGHWYSLWYYWAKWMQINELVCRSSRFTLCHVPLSGFFWE